VPLTLLQAVILGIVQGATEFIPVSSSAHLIVIPWLFGWNDPALTSLPFDVALHLGTLVAVLAFFASDWVKLARAWAGSIKERKIGGDPDRLLAWLVLIGTLPGAAAGVLAESKVEQLFHQPGTPIQPAAMLVVAAVIAGLGGVLLLSDRLARHVQNLGQLRLKEACIIGLAQALAVFPGVSRSGSTITAGLALGLKRDAAAKFSFLLSAPIIAGASLKSLSEVAAGLPGGSVARGDLILFAAGVVAAAASGYACIRFMMTYLRQHRVDVFVYYRWGLALLIASLALVAITSQR